jgi:RND family efflux transporter MFP subunit
MIVPKKSTLAIGFALLVIAAAIFLVVDAIRTKVPQWVTATVETGEVAEIVSVSGFIEAKNTADLAFPSSGIVTEVFAKEGQQVAAGEVLATLASTQLVAQRNEAQAGLNLAQARYDKLLAGADYSDRSIAEINVRNAEQKLARTISEEKEKVSNAQKALLSNDLSALSTDPNEDAPAPIVTGTYTCAEKGNYTLQLYSSSASTGYSYRYSGIEQGTAGIATDQPAPLGTCGLFLQFTADANYGNSEWIIDIPNNRSTTYLTYANAYALAIEQQANAVAQAEDAKALTLQQSSGVTADPRQEEIREARASIDQAKAKVAQIDALLEDRSIVAPFDGVVTSIHILKGETAPATPVVTVLASDAFELKARIPEIDITKLAVGQSVKTIFDARPQEIKKGSITYISPLAIKIDGVAYFEATVTLDETPAWIRSGLNADVDILIEKKENVLRIPKRFLIYNEGGTYSVIRPNGTETATTTVSLVFTGNDGFVAITGLNQGDVVIAP